MKNQDKMVCSVYKGEIQLEKNVNFEMEHAGIAATWVKNSSQLTYELWRQG